MHYLNKLGDFLGAKITGLVEAEDGFYGLELTKPDGKKVALIFFSDDEGNAPGSFEIQDLAGNPL